MSSYALDVEVEVARGIPLLEAALTGTAEPKIDKDADDRWHVRYSVEASASST